MCLFMSFCMLPFWRRITTTASAVIVLTFNIHVKTDKSKINQIYILIHTNIRRELQRTKEHNLHYNIFVLICQHNDKFKTKRKNRRRVDRMPNSVYSMYIFTQPEYDKKAHIFHQLCTKTHAM